ncbi:MAG: DUF2642 domain-containing protein [Planctomycetota bacterium]|nr:MAG: DUF2642 domain-containing protein [Planctomycetota bacterium]
MKSTDKILEKYLNQQVIVDTNTNFVFIGTLVEMTPDYVLLQNADAHDITQGSSSKERYLIESKKYVVKINRKEVLIRGDKVVSISLLEDLIV